MKLPDSDIYMNNYMHNNYVHFSNPSMSDLTYIKEKIKQVFISDKALRSKILNNKFQKKQQRHIQAWERGKLHCHKHNIHIVFNSNCYSKCEFGNIKNDNNYDSSGTVIIDIASYHIDTFPFDIVWNHIEYAIRHEYDYFLLRAPFIGDIYGISPNHTIITDYLWKSQRMILVNQLFTNSSYYPNVHRYKQCSIDSKPPNRHQINHDIQLGLVYQRLLYLDVSDAMFISMNKSIDDIVHVAKYDYYQHLINEMNSNSKNISINKHGKYPLEINRLSLIIAGDHRGVINTGVFIAHNTPYLTEMMRIWLKITQICESTNQQPLAILIKHEFTNLPKIFDDNNYQNTINILMYSPQNSPQYENLTRKIKYYIDTFAESTFWVCSISKHKAFDHNLNWINPFHVGRIVITESSLLNSNLFLFFNLKNQDIVQNHFIAHYPGGSEIQLGSKKDRIQATLQFVKRFQYDSHYRRYHSFADKWKRKYQTILYSYVGIASGKLGTHETVSFYLEQNTNVSKC